MLARSSLLALALAVGPALPGLGAEFVVDSLDDLRGDADPGDGVCASSDGSCSLVTAIEEANALPGPDTVVLIPGTSLVDWIAPRIRDDLEIRGVPGSRIEGGTDVQGARLVVKDVELWTGFLDAIDAALVLTDTHFSWGNVRLIRSSATITRFTHGTSFTPGPFLSAEDSDLVLSEVSLWQCGASYFEEPALVVVRGSLELLDSQVRGCPGSMGRPRTGGGLSVTDASVRIERTLFTKLGFCQAALQVDGSAELVVLDSTFIDNETTGLRANADRIELAGTLLQANTSYWYGQTESHPAPGGAAALTAPQVLVRDCQVLDNSSVGDGPSVDVGAGLRIDSADARIEDSLIRGNEAWASNHLGFRMREEGQANGGGLLLIGGTRIARCRIEANAATHGAGIHGSGVLLLIDSAVAANGPADGSVLPNDGAGLFNASGAATVVNTTITDNVGEDGAEVLAADGLVRLIHATIFHEDAPEGPPLEVRSGAELRARDTVLAGGWPQACGGTLNSEGGLLVEHPGACDLLGPAGSLITDVDPLLGPLRLVRDSPARTPQTGSPAIDAASACLDQDELPLTHDQRLDPRPADGDGDGGAVCDLGAIEVCFDPVDGDGDGIGDDCDVCPEHPDPLQRDRDDDGIGDACDVEEPSALDLEPSAHPLLVSAGGLVSWEWTDEPTWDLARGNLLSLPDSGLADSLELVITVTVPEHQVTDSGSLWFLAAGRRDRLTSSFGRDAHGNERPLP